MDNKTAQLGMSPGKASHRLVKDILFKYVQESGEVCFRCGQDLTREDFTIEHKTPWLHSEDPVFLFFDLENIAYSHSRCNSGAARKYLRPCGYSATYNRGCRCEECKKASAASKRRSYTPEKRATKYKTTGY